MKMTECLECGKELEFSWQLLCHSCRKKIQVDENGICGI